MLILLNFFLALTLYANSSAELNLGQKKLRSFDFGEISFLLKNVALVEKFHKNARINPLYFVGESKIQVEICEGHFPLGSPQRKELSEALKEYEKIPFGKISWSIQNVPHRNADEIISRSINVGSLRIDYADADAYPNECKDKGKGASWILTQCDYSIISGWKKWGIPLNDGGAILVNEHKYCKGNSNDCGDSYPKKQVFLHELGHFFGMAHSDEWPKELRIYSSVMGAFQDYLTAFDMKYMQKYYGDLKEDKTTKENLAVSGRVKGDKKKIKTGKIKEINPKALYLENGKIVKDCKTNEAPRFQFGFFNRSGKMYASRDVFALKLSLEKDENSFELTEILVSKLPPYAETHFSTIIPVENWPLELFNNKSLKIRFSIKTKDKFFPRHEISIKVKFHSNKEECFR
jgi:hypothetical protein